MSRKGPGHLRGAMTDQGETYAQFIESELKAERDRRTSYDARGQALITTSGALVTLLVGVAAIVRVNVISQLPMAVSVVVAAAILLLIAASGCGIVVGWNHRYVVAKVSTLER